MSVTLGKVNLALGNIQETLHHSQVLLETATEVGNKEYAGKALRLLGIGLWEQGDTREGKKRFEESLRTLEEVENKTELGKTCYELGQRLMRQKEHRPEGRAYLERAASIFKRVGVEEDLEQVMEVIAT